MKKNFIQVIKDNLIISITVVVVVIFIVVVSCINYTGWMGGGGSANATGQKVVKFINDNYLKTNGKAVLKSSSEVSGLYKISFALTVQGKDQGTQEAYVTEDGKLLFPSGNGIPVDISGKPAATTAKNNPPPADSNKVSSCADIKKSDKPLLEAFVVSSCPFGLQMQRVLANVVNAVGLTSNIKVEYIGSINNGVISSMHGPEEAQENLRQICIREEQPTKYWKYVSCYMKKTTATAKGGMPLGDTQGCLTSTGVDKASLNACVADSSRGLKYAAADFAAADKYGANGSPTLIINGTTADEFGFGGRTADALKSLVCCAFNNKPSVCSQTLSKDSAAASFSAVYSTASSGGSAPSNTNCNTTPQ